VNRTEIDALRDARVSPAVSILAPTHTHDPDNRVDPLTVKNLVKSATEALHGQMSKREAAPTVANIEAAVERIDWQHTGLGVAIFASPEHSLLYDLPLSPAATATVDERFAVRELVRVLNRSWRYRVLVLSEQPSRLYEGMREHLVEVRGGFPISHDGPGGATNTPGGFGISSSAMRDEFHRQFFRTIAESLAKHDLQDPLPLFVVGVDRYAAFWAEAAPEFAPVGVVHGSFDYMTATEISGRVWPTVEEYFTGVRRTTVERLDQARGQKRFAGGYDEVYRAARERRVDMLVAPEDATVMARLGGVHVEIVENDTDSTAPVEGDLVDVIVREVLTQGGTVVFLEADLLEPFGSIGAVLRY